MASKQSPPRVRSAQNAGIRKRQQWFDFAYKVASLLVKAALLGWLILQGRYAIEALAGEDTSVDVLVNWLSGDGTTITVSLSLGAICVVYGLRERHEKRRKTEKLAERIRQLETRLDAGRSSSGLAPDGRTNPVDRV